VIEKTNREDAISGLPIRSSQDLTEIASIPLNTPIERPEHLGVLKLKISGIPFEIDGLNGGRQILTGNRLSVTKETLSNLTVMQAADKNLIAHEDLLKSSMYIQADHPKIKTLVRGILDPGDKPQEKVFKLIAWMQKNIEKKPVISIPDALTTLENRVGDCNEHAMLFAALARAAGIPTRLEAGIVYLHGRFYYHAWNAVFIGRWVTADALFGQFPADVTHIRFSSGSDKFNLDMMSLIGKLKIELIS
jgi:hypothetical protein